MNFPRQSGEIKYNLWGAPSERDPCKMLFHGLQSKKLYKKNIFLAKVTAFLSLSSHFLCILYSSAMAVQNTTEEKQIILVMAASAGSKEIYDPEQLTNTKSSWSTSILVMR